MTLAGGSKIALLQMECFLAFVKYEIHSIWAKRAITLLAPSSDHKSPSVHVGVLTLSLLKSRSGHNDVPSITSLFQLPESALFLLSWDNSDES